MKPTLLTGASVFDGQHLLHKHSVLIRGGKIDAVMPTSEQPAECDVVSLDGGILAPGFVDLQVNGGGGVLFNNEPTGDALTRMLAGHATGGTVALLPTVISDRPETLARAVDAVKVARQQNPGLLGIHIEGPFFSAERRGVHHWNYVRDLTDTDVEHLEALAAELPVLLTLAPEHTRPGQIRRLVQAGITVSAGHTDASYEQIVQAMEEGLNGFTHLFNAMRPLQGREPGVVGAALESRSARSGIIIDGHHVHPASVRLAWQTLPAGHLYMVSDAMATTGSNEDQFQLYDQTITLRDGRLVNAEGRLAGAAIHLLDAVRMAVNDVGIPLTEALRMASLYPAQYIGQTARYGRMLPGRQADIVHLSDDLKNCRTWLAGREQPTLKDDA